MANRPVPPPKRENPSSDAPKQRSCGTMAVHERLLRTNPAYLASRVASENFAFETQQRAGLARTGITVIPVVVHVVYHQAQQNISDQQIQSQIDILNQDYRHLNADVASTPAVFLPLTTDARIEFALADKDPQGNPANGITRTSSNAASFSDDDGIKSAASGGADPWPADKYLNVWTAPRITSAQGDLLGYAQFPGGPAATDGVVILHSAFGNTGTAAAPFNLGRTASHEIGHWLNLRHIWGDDGTGCSGSDYVDDTPNQGGPNYGTPAFPHVSCNNGPDGDMFMNYMDYVDDVAMFMFTSGQVLRMQACLDSDRSTIGTTKPQTTFKFIDDQVTLKFKDDQATLKFADDPGTFKFKDDQVTFKFNDDPATLKFRDDQGTLKFADDPGTLKFQDDPGTLKFQDDPGTLKFVDDPGTLKYIDDVKLPTQDIRGKAPATDAQPMAGRTGARPAPFILSTPHHSMAWTQSYPGAARSTANQYETLIGQYEQALSDYQQAAQAGALSQADVQAANQLFDEYQALLAEYQQFMGQ
jgi:hypothetical protein